MISFWKATGCNDFDTHIWAKIKESKLGPSFIIIQDPTRYIASCWSHYLKNHIGQFWNDVICEQPLTLIVGRSRDDVFYGTMNDTGLDMVAGWVRLWCLWSYNCFVIVVRVSYFTLASNFISISSITTTTNQFYGLPTHLNDSSFCFLFLFILLVVVGGRARPCSSYLGMSSDVSLCFLLPPALPSTRPAVTAGWRPAPLSCSPAAKSTTTTTVWTIF